MKTISLLFFVLFINTVCVAQNKASKLTIDVLTSESKTLYVGFDNELEIKVDGKSTDLSVTVSHGALALKKEGVYVLKLSNSQTTQVVITVKKRIKGKATLIGTETLKIRFISTKIKFEKGKFKDSPKK